MMLDEAVFEEIKRAGRGTSEDIQHRISKRIYLALERLVRAERIIKEGFPGKGNPKTYSLPKPARVGSPPGSRP